MTDIFQLIYESPKEKVDTLMFDIKLSKIGIVRRVFIGFTLLCQVYSQNATASNQVNCWVTAGTKYNVDPWLLYSIAQVESNLDPLAINHNEKSEDHGLMQVNSWWILKLRTYGIDKKKLYDPCTNIHVGAWILAQSFQAFGNTWESVGAYNAGTAKTKKAKERRKKYAAKVYKQYMANIKIPSE